MSYTGAMKKIVVVIVILAALLAAWKLWIADPDIPADSANTIAQEQAAPTRIYTTGDLEQHASATDCWLAQGGKVYDATAFVATPVGTALVPGCGTDATALFAGQPAAWQDEARAALEARRIGDFAQ